MRKPSMMEILSTHRLDTLKHVKVSELDLSIKDLYSLGKANNWVHLVKVMMCEWFQHLSFNRVLKMIARKIYFDNSGHGNEETRQVIAMIQKLLSLSRVFVLSNVIPCVEWMDLQGHLGLMKRVAKELDSLVGYKRNREERHKKMNRRQNTSKEKTFFVFVSLFY